MDEYRRRRGYSSVCIGGGFVRCWGTVAVRSFHWCSSYFTFRVSRYLLFVAMPQDKDASHMSFITYINSTLKRRAGVLRVLPSIIWEEAKAQDESTVNHH